MTFDVWLAFVVSTCFISGMPGSNMLLAFQFGLNYGLKKTLWTLAGLTLGLFLLLLASLLGIGYLSQQMPVAFEVMKVLGAIYLAYLGVQVWRKSREQMGKINLRVVPTPAKLFQTGVAVSLSNPKAILFFAAFFPKFINTQAEPMPQYFILAATFFVIETSWQLLYTGSGKALAAWLSEGGRLMWLNRICGVIFVLIAVGLVYDVIKAV